jgi:parvulin-like peptidyl-prolyl isomerase
MPSRRWLVLGLLFLPAIVGFYGCRLKDRTQPELNAAIVQIGEKKFSTADLERFFDSRLNELREAVDADVVKSSLLDSFIEEKLLLHQAEQLKIEPRQQAIDAMREKLAASGTESSTDLKRDKDLDRSMKESLQIREYLRDHLFKGLSVTKEECEAYYKEHLDDFVRNDVVHVREILVDDEAKAKEIQASLKAKRNKNFNELARLYSKAPTAAEGGDMGTFQRGDLTEDFEKVIFPLAPGTISKIVRTQYGYHTFLVEEKILAHQQRFFEVEDQIQERLLLERQRAALNKEVTSLANQIPVRVDQERLDFKYVSSRFASLGGKH